MPKLITIQIISSQRVEGQGVEADPTRLVSEWYSTDGTLLLALDPYTGQTYGAINMAEFLSASSQQEKP